MSSLIEDLQYTDAFPEATSSVFVVQTHISMVFVCDLHVYKIKKPVNFGFLDFSTLDKRRHFCHKEVELNRRLAKDIYLGVVPVIFDGKRHLIDKGEGEIVDYAVKMKRISEDMLMSRVFERGELKKEDLIKVAKAIANFHINAETSPEIEAFGRAESFRINTDENFEQVEKYIGLSIDEKKFHELKEWTEEFYKKYETLFESRIKQKRVRDCHGDLHMEHICLTDELPIIDCIEFNDRFRYSDTIADIAFLLMDLEYRGGFDYSNILWENYKGLANEDEEAELVLKFYKVYRAFVRGKVNSFQLDDPSISQKAKEEAIKRARSYFDLAYSYL
ncbi:MAG: gluconokinase [Deltaproteobacteria bacterium]|nr:MAG: gluconokinase [Deltaproteobacteria bacterium]